VQVGGSSPTVIRRAVSRKHEIQGFGLVGMGRGALEWRNRGTVPQVG
jgi:hypothetical protein